MTKEEKQKLADEYQSLLDRARKQIPPKVFEHDRFEFEKRSIWVTPACTLGSGAIDFALAWFHIAIAFDCDRKITANFQVANFFSFFVQ